MRSSLAFQELGEIAGMIAVDQVGVLAVNKNLYIHQDQSDFGSFVSAVMQESAANSYSVTEMQPDADDDHFDGDEVTIPPTPLTSLLSLSEGSVGGAVLTGYGTTFNKKAYFWSHMDSAFLLTMNRNAIATAATVLARAALAAAYDDGSLDYETAAAYAAEVIPSLRPTNETLLELADCLYVSQRCKLFSKFARVEAANEKARTGLDLGVGEASVSSPPDYYVSVFNMVYGQPFVQVDNARFGAYDGDKYGEKETDVVASRPMFLEMAVKGLLNDFLGRSGSDSDDKLVSCRSSSACSSVDYCGDAPAVCTGNHVCVCDRSHYHVALDEAIEAAANNATGFFVPVEDEEQVSAVYAEPNWSPSVGVRIYRSSGGRDGLIVLLFGLGIAGISVLASLMLRFQLKKQKLY